jgi:D-3-phosphoglycerate dehydrogenase
LLGKTFGIIGYGNMGKATAKRLSGFGVEVIFYDILPDLSDEFASRFLWKNFRKELIF